MEYLITEAGCGMQFCQRTSLSTTRANSSAMGATLSIREWKAENPWIRLHFVSGVETVISNKMTYPSIAYARLQAYMCDKRMPPLAACNLERTMTVMWTRDNLLLFAISIDSQDM